MPIPNASPPTAVALLVVAARNARDPDLGSIVGSVLVGVVVGILARLLVPGRDHLGVVGTLAIGIVGALIGGWLAGAVFPHTAGIDWIASIAAAIVLILLIRAASGRRRWSWRRLWGWR
jgi:uncharacterized membrane protein YeaQ/YmgE (transglycosylase-associated protein family)